MQTFKNVLILLGAIFIPLATMIFTWFYPEGGPVLAGQALLLVVAAAFAVKKNFTAMGVYLAGFLFLWTVYPYARMMLCLAGDGKAFGALHSVSSRVLEYRELNGRLPADLSELNLPELTVYSYESDDRKIHRHRIAGVELRPGAGLENFKVLFSTYIARGHAVNVAVTGDFNGFDPAKGRMSDTGANGFYWALELPLPPGRYSFRIVADGRQGPLETVDVDHATRHANAAAAARPLLAGDTGKWLYDPRTGLVALGCSGVDTKHRRPWYAY